MGKVYRPQTLKYSTHTFVYISKTSQISTPKQGMYTSIKICSPSFNGSDNYCLGHYGSKRAGASREVIRSKQDFSQAFTVPLLGSHLLWQHKPTVNVFICTVCAYVLGLCIKRRWFWPLMCMKRHSIYSMIQPNIYICFFQSYDSMCHSAKVWISICAYFSF